MEKSKWSEHCKPHARGDGPVIEAQAEADANVNPTHVGMDRNVSATLTAGRT